MVSGSVESRRGVWGCAGSPPWCSGIMQATVALLLLPVASASQSAALHSVMRRVLRTPSARAACATGDTTISAGAQHVPDALPG